MNCQETQVQCYDGTCAESEEACFGLPEGYFEQGEEESFIYEPGRHMSIEDIYQRMGGEEELHMSEDEFINNYEYYFPEYDIRDAEKWSDDLYRDEQLWELTKQGYAGSLEGFGLRREGFRDQQTDLRTGAEGKLRTLALGHEGTIRSRRGISTGFTDRTSAAARETVTEEFKRGSRDLDLTKESAGLEEDAAVLDMQSRFGQHQKSTTDLTYKIDKSYSDFDDRLYNVMGDLEEEIAVNWKLNPESWDAGRLIEEIIAKKSHWEPEDFDTKHRECLGYMRHFYRNARSIATYWYSTGGQEVEWNYEAWVDEGGVC